ncbi:MAG: AAA family ATPase [Polymorphobacter sp.]|uniref:AAA family ATPase n=1 Tax=Polymorphobacter sp. TaxID=1909290 RepID=UPI003A874601
MSALGQMLAAEYREDTSVLASALSYISSDVLRGNGTIIGADGQPETDYWFGCMLAARRTYGETAKEVMRNWSQQSLRYGDGSGFEHAWKQHDPNLAKPITVGSLFMLAKLNGWPGTSHRPPIAAPQTPDSARFRLLDRASIMAQLPMRWRVKGLLPETGIGAIYGPSGSGKSYLGIDLGINIARGCDWFGHRTTPCGVTYVILEGEAGLRNRVEAWEVHNGSLIPSSFKAMAQPFQLAEQGDVEDLGAILPPGGVVIIDTLNRAAPGLDENSSQDMGHILAGMKRLQESTGGLVIVVHHTGKDASKGMRGHSSLHAALDGAIEVERSATSRCWSAAKVKDGEDGKQVPFKLHVIDLGRDADGDIITSCAVGPDTGAIFRKPEPSGKSQKSALSAIRRLLGASSTFGQAGCDPQTRCIKVDDAIAGVAATLTTTASNKRSNEARRLVGDLTKGNKHLQSAIDGSGEAWLWQ